jgi:hypothetical protein
VGRRESGHSGRCKEETYREPARSGLSALVLLRDENGRRARKASQRKVRRSPFGSGRRNAVSSAVWVVTIRAGKAGAGQRDVRLLNTKLAAPAKAVFTPD